ncbi:MAG TPA: DUF692 domain-containing protein [Methylocella sp.]|nr:DUF692 domain-containing protein [Methylocella sp.]
MSERFDCPVSGAGLGLRRSFLESLSASIPDCIGFFEVAPENWMRVGGTLSKSFRSLTERAPFVAHGLSLSLGGPSPLDFDFLHELKQFLDDHRMLLYSEHLSFCGDNGHLYDLLPIPFTWEAAAYTAERIRQVQDVLERRIAIENISYYAPLGQEISEIDFLTAVLECADCDLLLDVNNVYVNSVNHGYSADEFLQALPANRITYLHIAGHHQESPELLIDTHGTPIIPPVWSVLDGCYQRFGVLPTLLERDFNIPPLKDLLAEIRTIHRFQAEHAARGSFCNA